MSTYKQGLSINPTISIIPKAGGLPNELILNYEYNYLVFDKSKKTIISRSQKNDWDMKKQLTSITGQLNYFYNSGLRLPFVKKAESTKSIYDFWNKQRYFHLYQAARAFRLVTPRLYQ